jgi:hypothetical protein
MEMVKTSETVNHEIRRATPDDVPGILECLRLAFAPYGDEYIPEAFARHPLKRTY